MKNRLMKSSCAVLGALILGACGKPPETNHAPSAQALKKAGELEASVESATEKLKTLGCEFEAQDVVSKNTTRKKDYRLNCSPSLTSTDGESDPLMHLRTNYEILNEYRLVSNVLVRNKAVAKSLRTDVALKAYAVSLQQKEIKDVLDSLAKSETSEVSLERVSRFEAELKALGCGFEDGGARYTCSTLDLAEGLIRFEKLYELVRVFNIAVANASLNAADRVRLQKQKSVVSESYADELSRLKESLRSTPLADLRAVVENSSNSQTLLKAIGAIDMEIKLHLLTRPEVEDDSNASLTIRKVNS